MKALLINGPRHLTTLKLGDVGIPPVIVIPKPMPANMLTRAFAMDTPPAPEFETVVYRVVSQAAVGGFMLYLAESE